MSYEQQKRKFAEDMDKMSLEHALEIALQERDHLAYERGVAKALTDANEVLHRFAMQTKDTNTLDLIESIQKEILETLTK